jgi:hypothetical protein
LLSASDCPASTTDASNTGSIATKGGPAIVHLWLFCIIRVSCGIVTCAMGICRARMTRTEIIHAILISCVALLRILSPISGKTGAANASGCNVSVRIFIELRTVSPTDQDARQRMTFPYPPPPYAVDVRRGSQCAPPLSSSSSKNGSAEAAAAAAAASATSRSNLRALLLLIQVVMRRNSKTTPIIPATARKIPRLGGTGRKDVHHDLQNTAAT